MSLTLLLSYAPLVLFVAIVILCLIAAGEPERRRVGIAGVAVLGAIASLILVAGPIRPADPWADWSGQIDQAVTGCAENVDGSVCLARAIHEHAPPEPEGTESSVTSRFMQDVRVAQALIAAPKARDLLRQEFGVDASEFLGTGYSVSFEEPEAARSYTDAHQPEFFVPNLCADSVDHDACPTESANLYTWRVPATEARRWLGRPITDLLNSQAPVDHAAEWRRLARAGNTHLLVRFARFNPQYYTGKVGRPASDLVFFTSLNEVRGVPLREALARTGSEALAQPGAANEVMFVWIYAPTDHDDAARPATWASLYSYLDQLAAPH
ncbi:MAG: hypothetical protein ABUL55_01330 [Pseudomonadota bacterium]